MSEPEARHRLAAILAADAAGYSRVMAEDDRVALATLDAARIVFRKHIEAQGGRVIDESEQPCVRWRHRAQGDPRRPLGTAGEMAPEEEASGGVDRLERAAVDDACGSGR